MGHARLVEGLVLRQAKYIKYDPYANAFRIDESYVVTISDVVTISG